RQERNEHEPIQDQVAKIDRDQGPGVRAQEAEPGAEVIAVATQILDFGCLGIGSCIGARPREITDDIGQAFVGALNPGGEPAADVSAARDGREVMKLLEKAATSQPLQYSERKRRAAKRPP